MRTCMGTKVQAPWSVPAKIVVHYLNNCLNVAVAMMNAMFVWLGLVANSEAWSTRSSNTTDSQLLLHLLLSFRGYSSQGLLFQPVMLMGKRLRLFENPQDISYYLGMGYFSRKCYSSSSLPLLHVLLASIQIIWGMELGIGWSKPGYRYEANLIRLQMKQVMVVN